MAEITIDEMRNAIEALLEARHRAVDALKMTDPDDPTKPFLPQTFPEPATPDAISTLEDAIGTLPPSYRFFFETHDGLPQADMGADIFSTSALLEFRSNEAEGVYARLKDKIDDRASDRLVFLGASDSRRNVFIFDTQTADESGEWSVIDYTVEEGIVDEHPSFLAFIEDLTSTLDLTAKAYEK